MAGEGEEEKRKEGDGDDILATVAWEKVVGFFNDDKYC